MRPARPVDVGRLGLGVLAVVRPRWVLRLTGSPEERWVPGTVRILGIRYILQSGGGLVLASSAARPWVREVDAGVDAIHAASMLAVAAAVPRHRRLALLSAGAAVVFAALDLTEELR